MLAGNVCIPSQPPPYLVNVWVPVLIMRCLGFCVIYSWEECWLSQVHGCRADTKCLSNLLLNSLSHITVKKTAQHATWSSCWASPKFHCSDLLSTHSAPRIGPTQMQDLALWLADPCGTTQNCLYSSIYLSLRTDLTAHRPRRGPSRIASLRSVDSTFKEKRSD